jgi:hypothetical protein
MVDISGTPWSPGWVDAVEKVGSFWFVMGF